MDDPKMEGHQPESRLNYRKPVEIFYHIQRSCIENANFQRQFVIKLSGPVKQC